MYMYVYMYLYTYTLYVYMYIYKAIEIEYKNKWYTQSWDINTAESTQEYTLVPCICSVDHSLKHARVKYAHRVEAHIVRSAKYNHTCTQTLKHTHIHIYLITLASQRLLGNSTQPQIVYRAGIQFIWEERWHRDGWHNLRRWKDREEEEKERAGSNVMRRTPRHGGWKKSSSDSARCCRHPTDMSGPPRCQEEEWVTCRHSVKCHRSD